MIDIHSHALPGVDDGAGGMVEAVRMLSLAEENGTKGIVLTPHANLSRDCLNYYDSDLAIRFDSLRKEAKENGLNIKVFEGQEIFCSGRVLTLIREGRLIPINNSRYLLIEFAFDEFPSSMIKKIAQIRAEGFIPVIAHPERYYSVIETTDVAKRMKAEGAFLQVNKDSIEGNLGEGAFSAAHRILDRSLADFVASDAHTPYSRNTSLSEVHEYISEEYSIDYANYLLNINPRHILRNESLY